MKMFAFSYGAFGNYQQKKCSGNVFAQALPMASSLGTETASLSKVDELLVASGRERRG
jgi:hypothetical protein